MTVPKRTTSVPKSRREAERWIEKTLTQLNYKISGEPTAVVEKYLGDVWCIETDKGNVYFKATADLPLFANEAEICFELTHLFKPHVPDVIAFDKERCWLLMHDFGVAVGHEKDADIDTLSDIYHTWGGLQRQSVKHLGKLRLSSCQSRSIDNLVEQLYWHIEQPAIATALRALGIVYDKKFRLRLESAVEQLNAYSLPECLVHGDLHDNNVAKTEDSFLFYDWSDACISHPFMEGHIMYRIPKTDKRDMLIKRYLSNWTHHLTADELLHAWDIAEPLCYAHHAVTYASFVEGMPKEFEKDKGHCAHAAAVYVSWALNFMEPEAQSVAALQTLLDRAVSSPAIPGVSAVLVKDDAILWCGAAGYADLERKIKMTVNHVQNIASVTKTITTAAVMQQVERGNLNLDQDINHYLAFSVRNPKFPDVPITIRQLLIHRSSITDGPAYNSSYACGDPIVKLSEWIEGYLTPQGGFYNENENFLNWEPGTIDPDTPDPDTPPDNYSNVAFGLLGLIVEVVSGSDFRDYCQTELFDILGMDQTRWNIGNASDHVVPYTYIKDPTEIEHRDLLAKSVKTAALTEGDIVPYSLYSFYNYPDGLLRTTPTDLSAFLRACIGGGKLNGKRILTEETVNEMFRDHFEGQALCWRTNTSLSGGQVLDHSGEDPGVSTLLAYRDRDNVGVIVFFNCSNSGVHSRNIVNGIFALMNKLESNRVAGVETE